MAWNPLSSFNLDPRENTFLFLEHGRPRSSALLLAGVVLLLLFGASYLIDPNWHPQHMRGRGAALVALLLLMPIAVRVVVIGVTAGFLAEAVYRGLWRGLDGKPDYIIGISGVADLNPWAPRVIRWDELREIRRITNSSWLSKKTDTLCLQFVARHRCPASLPQSLWDLLPGFVTERRIALGATWVGLDERTLESLIERYAGRIAIRDVSYR